MELFELNREYTDLLAILLPLLVIPIGLSIAVLSDSYLTKRLRQTFLLSIALSISLVAQNYLEMWMTELWNIPARTAFSVYGYCVRPLILLLFCSLVEPQNARLYRPGWVLVGVNAVMYLTTPLTKLVFYIDSGNHYHAGPLYRLCLYVSLILLAWQLWLSIRMVRRQAGKNLALPLFIVLMILVSVYLDYQVGDSPQPVSFLTIAIICAAVLFYLWLHLQLVQVHERGMREQQQLQLMFSQIKPHFLYNTLETIEALCLIDPEAAREATARFSGYLRGNLTGLNAENTIPFEKELSHTRLYLELEQMRFQEDLQVVYEITCTDFFLPPLTLQPLAENAVRHGVRMKSDGKGIVEIKTAELPDCYVISVRDDGPGFDPNTPPTDGRPHIGLRNVRDRLQRHGGALHIESKQGSGTTVTIRIPKTEQEEKSC